MFGKLGDMMGQLQEMKRKAEETKKKLEGSMISRESTDGSIKIRITGTRKIESIEITDTAIQSDKAKFESQLKEVINKAIEEADALNETEMKKVAGGLLPGLSNLL